MEPQPDEDPEHDGPPDREPGPAAPRPDDAGPAARPAGSGPPGSGGSGAFAPARRAVPVPVPVGMPVPDAVDGEDDGSDFGSWEDVEGTLGAAREREELLSGFAPGGVWDVHPPGAENPSPDGTSGRHRAAAPTPKARRNIQCDSTKA